MELTLTKEKLEAHMTSIKSLQKKLFLLFDDGVSGLSGIEKLLALSSWAQVTGNLFDLAAKSAIALKETLVSKGIEITAGRDVRIDDLNAALFMPTRPGQRPEAIHDGPVFDGYEDDPDDEEEDL